MNLYSTNWQFCELLQYFAVLKRIMCIVCEIQYAFKTKLSKEYFIHFENNSLRTNAFLRRLSLLLGYLWTLIDVFLKIRCGWQQFCIVSKGPCASNISMYLISCGLKLLTFQNRVQLAFIIIWEYRLRWSYEFFTKEIFWYGMIKYIFN